MRTQYLGKFKSKLKELYVYKTCVTINSHEISLM